MTRREAPCHDPNRPRIPPHTHAPSHQARKHPPSSSLPDQTRPDQTVLMVEFTPTPERRLRWALPAFG
jgi:hypothetical protein